MLQPILLESEQGQERIRALRERRLDISSPHEATVRDILNQVRAHGDAALVDFTCRFDAPDFAACDLKVSPQEMEQAYGEVEADFLASLRKAMDHIEAFHRRQLPKSWILTQEDGVITGQMVQPVDAAGLYVPGGKGGETPLVSSVLMNAIPAKIAGVERIILATPPNRERRVNSYLLVAAAEAGIREIYKMGSAWAVAAMAFGTETVTPVDVIVGPGNIFVTLAKKLVAGLVGIDMIAGPSEILIIADETAPPAYVAADLLSQAEHDPMATAVLLTTSEALAQKVAAELSTQLEVLPRRDMAEKSLRDNGLLLVVKDLEAAADLANKIAPEHLELMVADPWGLLPRIRHAGAIFLGRHTPEAIGDYIAGPNHVLPTMGTARFSSALGVETFLKRSSVIAYGENAFHRDAADVIRMAEREGLDAHARSVKVRL